jgi:hypothetical protein
MGPMVRSAGGLGRSNGGRLRDFSSISESENTFEPLLNLPGNQAICWGKPVGRSAELEQFLSNKLSKETAREISRDSRLDSLFTVEDLPEAVSVLNC